MTLVDEIVLKVQSGQGGDGTVQWIRNRRISKGGPAGGDGGRGGDVVVRAVRDVARLSKYRGNTFFKAEDGGGGGKNSLHGHNGEDMIIDLPVGSTVLYESETHTAKKDSFELLQEGETVVITRGGAGGFGNEHFKSSRNVAPQESTQGKMGDSGELHVELKLIADIGLVGYPNAGKSSLLNSVTNASSKIGNYAFTTLEPHLGELFGYIIADIPGIIEGASEGKGLGHKFLKHITRTKRLLYCISIEQDEPISAYETLKRELETYDSRLGEVSASIVLTKTDMTTTDDVANKIKQLRSVFDGEILDLTILDDTAIKLFTKKLLHILKEHKGQEVVDAPQPVLE